MPLSVSSLRDCTAYLFGLPSVAPTEGASYESGLVVMFRWEVEMYARRAGQADEHVEAPEVARQPAPRRMRGALGWALIAAGERLVMETPRAQRCD